MLGFKFLVWPHPEQPCCLLDNLCPDSQSGGGCRTCSLMTQPISGALEDISLKSPPPHATPNMSSKIQETESALHDTGPLGRSFAIPDLLSGLKTPIVFRRDEGACHKMPHSRSVGVRKARECTRQGLRDKTAYTQQTTLPGRHTGKCKESRRECQGPNP